MNIRCYNFFFRPCAESHSRCIKITSTVTVVVLSIISAMLYLIAFLIVRKKERSWQQVAVPLAVSSVMIGGEVRFVHDEGLLSLEDLKTRQKKQVMRLEVLAGNGQWEPLQTHTSHDASGFDWWMFPVDRPSRGYGDQYQVNQAQIAILRNDPEFMESYRKGVILVAKSWGWDVENGQDITNENQRWTGYDVRLGKMLNSLILFEQKDLYNNLVQCIDKKGIRSSLAGWVKSYLDHRF